MRAIVSGANQSTQIREAGSTSPPAGAAGRAGPPPGIPESVADDILQHALEQVADLERMLASTQCETAAAFARLASIASTVSGARANVVRLEEEAANMRHCAYHDELTGLPNRSLLMDRLDRTLAQRSRQNRKAALLLLDLDDFKQVNDTYGHAVGDGLLREVARRLLGCTRNEDTIARYGGDEFIILLPDVEGRRDANDVARKIQVHLAEPFAIGGHSISVTACIGIAVYPVDGPQPDILIARADAAMYRAKNFAHAVTPLR